MFRAPNSLGALFLFTHGTFIWPSTYYSRERDEKSMGRQLQLIRSMRVDLLSQLCSNQSDILQNEKKEEQFRVHNYQQLQQSPRAPIIRGKQHH